MTLQTQNISAIISFGHNQWLKLNTEIAKENMCQKAQSPQKHY